MVVDPVDPDQAPLMAAAHHGGRIHSRLHQQVGKRPRNLGANAHSFLEQAIGRRVIHEGNIRFLLGFIIVLIVLREVLIQGEHFFEI